MKLYGTTNGYRRDDADGDDGPEVVVTISITTDPEVDPHQAMANLIDTCKDLLEAMHAQTDCVHISDEERAAAFSAMFLNDPFMEGNN